MALTDIFVRQLKHSGNGTAEKHTDGAEMYLFVKGSGKYWHRNCRYGGKRNTLALGTCPEMSLAKAPQKRDRAREVRAEGEGPGPEHRQASRATGYDVCCGEHIRSSGSRIPCIAGRPDRLPSMSCAESSGWRKTFESGWLFGVGNKRRSIT